MGKPHKHAAIIKAWADGAVIQYSTNGEYWYDSEVPKWELRMLYRVKPERVFPKSTLSTEEAYKAFFGKPLVSELWCHHKKNLQDLADAAIKQYILDTEKK